MLLNLRILCFSFIAFSQLVHSAELYKENFPGGVYIVDGDETYANKLAIPGVQKKSKNSTDLIINIIGKNIQDKWKKKEAQALTYCVSNKFKGNKQVVVDALKTATEDWMATANIKFIHLAAEDAKCDQKNSNVMFDVRPIVGQPYLARAFFPSTERISRNILINSTTFKFDESAITGFLRHELGHTLGFRHEHISKKSSGLCPEDTSYFPITEYDQSSVMHYPQCGGLNIITNMVLTAIDEKGARLAYPF
jgi:serralysin